jgi:hypothetical protein
VKGTQKCAAHHACGEGIISQQHRTIQPQARSREEHSVQLRAVDFGEAGQDKRVLLVDERFRLLQSIPVDCGPRHHLVNWADRKSWLSRVQGAEPPPDDGAHGDWQARPGAAADACAAAEASAAAEAGAAADACAAAEAALPRSLRILQGDKVKIRTVQEAGPEQEAVRSWLEDEGVSLPVPLLAAHRSQDSHAPRGFSTKYLAPLCPLPCSLPERSRACRLLCQVSCNDNCAQ